MANEIQNIPEGFKMTELGPLPEDWQVVRLGEVCQLSTIQINPYESPGMKYVGLEHIEPGNTQLRRWGFSDEVRSSKTLFKPNDVLYGKLRPYLDKAAIAEWEGVCSTDILVLRANNKIEPLFLALFAHTKYFIAYAVATTAGVNHPRTSWQALQKISIPLPPLPEQRAIAHVLRTVQQAREATERVVAALRDLKKSLMRHLFTYGPVPIAHVGAKHVSPLRETEIGPLPEHWQVVRLGEVVERTEQVDPIRTPEWKFKYVDVSCVNNELLQITDYQICTGKDAPSRARKLIKAGDVIFATVRPYLKRIALIPADLDGQICSTAFCVLRPLPDLINGGYLFFVVSRDEFVARVAEHQRGSSYPAVTDGDVKRGLIPLPPLAEQREIARILQAVDRRIAAEEAYARALGDLFKTLLHDLMTARRRVPVAAIEILGARQCLAPTAIKTIQSRTGHDAL